MRAAVRTGLSHLAVTDHERIDGALRARDLAPPELTVIVGQEVRTSDGDMIALFLERPIAPGMPAAETAAAIHEQGGLCGLPHPFDRFRSSGGARMREAAQLAALAAAVDFVEAWNARVPFGRANERAAEFAREHKLPGVASSDAHTSLEIGVAYTILPEAFGTAQELRALLPRASLVTGRASLVVRALGPLAKALNHVRGNRRIQAAVVPPERAAG